MTLIASYRSATTGFLGISDILISRETAGEPAPVRLPFRANSLAHRHNDHILSGYSQKSIPFGRTLILWAGYAMVASVIIAKIVEKSANGDRIIELKPIIDSLCLSEQEMKNTSILYHFRVDNDHINVQSLNHSFHHGSDDYDLIGDGSGFWNFFFNIEHKPDETLAPHDARLADLFSKVLFHAIMEHNSTDSLDYMYGGWFEFTSSRYGKFEKVPYAIKFWSKQGDILGSGGPLLYGWYNNDHLVITRLNFYETSGQIRFAQENFPVPDYLRRTEFNWPVETNTRPEFVAHIVFNEDMRTSGLLLEKYDGVDMILEGSKEGIRCAWTHNLRHRLFNLGPGKASMRLSSKPDQ